MHAGTNYIYIVFAILYVIYSIVKAVKKNSQQKPVTKKPEPSQTVRPPTSSPLPNPGDDMKKMLEEILGKTPEVKIPAKPIVRPEPVKIKQQPAKIITHAQKIKASPSHIPHRTKEEVKPFLSGEKEIAKKVFVETEVEEERDLDFDIRQAIIYSEILKRPQY